MAKRALVLVALLPLAACMRQEQAQTPPPSPVLARVDGFALTEADLEDEIARLPKALRARVREEDLRRRVAEALIERLALAAAATRMGLDRDPRVQRAIARARARILEDALRSRVAAQVPPPSDEEIRRRYEKEKARYRLPARVRLAAIVVDDAGRAQRISRLLARHPERFDAYRRRFSKARKPEHGADGWRTLEELPEAVRKAVEGLPEGGISAPVKTDAGWALYRVLAREEAHVLPLATVRDEIAAEILHARVKRRLEELAGGVPVEWLVPKNAP